MARSWFRFFRPWWILCNGLLGPALLLAEQTGRAIDLIDLQVVAEPLLGQILRHGRRLLGGDRAYGELISRHLFEQADFMPYRARVLAERRAAWIGK